MTSERRARSADQEPWERENPRTASGHESKHLSAAQKASAKKHAKAAGRPYPNLIDNMQAAKTGVIKAKK